jgi:hypothetical protein
MVIIDNLLIKNNSFFQVLFCLSLALAFCNPYSLFSGELAFGADEPRKGMGIFDPLLSESPVNNIPHQQLFLKGMPQAESHPTDDANRHGILIHSLFRTHITLHISSSLFDGYKHLINFITERAKNQKR